MATADGERPVGLGAERSFSARLAEVMEEICAMPGMAGLGRVAVAVYDAATDILKAFAHATEGVAPFAFYARRLAEVPSLRHLAESGSNRVVTDLAAGAAGEHDRLLLEAGMRSSYTVALRDDDCGLLGFLFFDCRDTGFFTAERVRILAPYVRVVTLMLAAALERLVTIRAAVRTVRDIGAYRDDETGAHLDRMARYARLIAQKLAPRLGMTEEWVESLAQLAPLHDIGKIAIPDSILLKPGRLSPEEFRAMQSHVDAGTAIVATLVRNFHIEGLPHAELMANLVACHHEGMDGSGYPRGLTGAAIPVEARIVSVADVFDALTSARAYKRAWSNDEAIAYLQEQAGRKFDPDCVAALVAARPEVEHIQASFAERG